MSLSIITVHLNDFSGLEKTLRSLQHHLTSDQIQWIVIDGGSVAECDYTTKLLEAAEALSDVFISEPDNGIYSAMNKGAHLATEQYMLFLNAGDILHPDFDLSSVFKSLGDSRPDMVWGCFGESGKSNAVQHIHPKNVKWIWWGMPTSHQAILFKREALDEPVYDESLEIAGDYDLVLKLLQRGASSEPTSFAISIVDGTGVSNADKSLALSEQMLVRKRNLGTPYVLNMLISAAHLLSATIGQIRLLRLFWK